MEKIHCSSIFIYCGRDFSYVFIEVITEAVKSSTFEMKLLWGVLVPIFTITDIIIYAKTGEEIISSILEWAGIELE